MADKRKNDDDTVSEKASGSVWAGVCVSSSVPKSLFISVQRILP